MQTIGLQLLDRGGASASAPTALRRTKVENADREVCEEASQASLPSHTTSERKRKKEKPFAKNDPKGENLPPPFPFSTARSSGYGIRDT